MRARVLALFIALLLGSGGAFAQHEKGDTWEVDGINYEVTSTAPQEVMVVSKYPKYEGKIIIPEKVEKDGKEYAVTEIDNDAFDRCESLVSVTIPSSIRKIRDGKDVSRRFHDEKHGAFSECSSLVEVFVNAGYIGSSRALSYTVIGDTVNTSARLCSHAKTGEILVSQMTHDKLGSRFEYAELEPAKVKGKEKPLAVFNVLRRAPAVQVPR